MAVAWPGTIPQGFLIDGYQEQIGANVATFEPDVQTVPMVRQRTSVAPDELQCRMLLNSTQLQAFKTFYQTTLKSGTIAFTKYDAMKQATATYYFISQPAISPAGLRFSVTFSVVRLP